MQQQGEIRINTEGEWFFNGAPIVNRRVLELFNASIQPDARGGYCLHIGEETSPLTVEDTPYVVTHIEREPDAGRFVIRLSDGASEELCLDTLYLAADNVPYCRVKSGRFSARFKRAPYYALAAFIEQEGERFFVQLNGSRHYIEIRP
jgi:hypothetical protein